MYANLLAEHSIRVNTLHPTGVDTAMVRNAAFESFTKEHPDLSGNLRNALPKSLLAPEDVTKTILWLNAAKLRSFERRGGVNMVLISSRIILWLPRDLVVRFG
jgi:NAD(P)-dependent dehydrogenase (short-subunit alcohol dehydrogenase family)